MVSINEKSKLIKIIQKEPLTEEDKEELRQILSKLPSEELKSLLGKEYELFTKNLWSEAMPLFVIMGKVQFFGEDKKSVSRAELNSRNSEGEEEIAHYNKWLTDNIKNYIKNLDNRIKFLFKPYKTFKGMNDLFELGFNYIKDQRLSKHAKKVIAKSVLNEMRKNFKQKVQEWSEKLKDPDLIKLLIKAQNDILKFIDDYETRFKPKPTPRSQIYNHHPNFKVNYFSKITNVEQARMLGFLLADGCISIEHKKSGNYYRIELTLQRADEEVLHDLCNELGLDPKYIYPFDAYCNFDQKAYPMSQIKWTSNDMAEDLIKLGMKYEFDDKKGHRVKVPKLPDLGSEELNLALLFGFYEGDGNLGSTKDENGEIKFIGPTVSSSNYEFLSQIKKIFNLKYKIQPKSSETYNYRKNMIVKSEVYTLYLGTELFSKMLKAYSGGLKRKRVSLEFLEKYGVSPVRRWLIEVLPKEKLQQMLEFLSPTFIAKTLGVSLRTITRLAEDYGIEIKQASYYKSIQNSIRFHGESSQYFKDFDTRPKFLGNLGKFEN